MIRGGISTPQQVTITGTNFITTAVVLVTMPSGTDPVRVTPISATSTTVIFSFAFAEYGTYTIIIADATGECDECASAPFSLALTADPDDARSVEDFQTLASLRATTRHRLGDDRSAIWDDDEIDGYLRECYRMAATQLPLFWDRTYPENLPRGFSVTQRWELLHLNASGRFDYGVANYTASFEARLGFDERLHDGPANHTSPFEATDGKLEDAGASTDIPATADLPATLTALDRVLWDTRVADALDPRNYSLLDSRYEITKGEVFGFMWQKDGIRTLRKVRVPAAQADTVTVTGTWGALRNASGLSSDTAEGTWGIVRQVPGLHPMGPDATFGMPRRVYLEGKNVRVEHFRQGRVLADGLSLCELPPRYARYLVHYAFAKCVSRPGPGYDKQLGELFMGLWTRGLARMTRRVQTVDMEHVTVLGGDGEVRSTRPPRARLPWAYGSRVR